MKLILLGLTLQLLPLNLSIDSHTALSITELFGLVLILIGAFLQSQSDREFRRMQWLALGGVALCGASYVLAKTIGTGLVIDQSLVPGSALPRYFVVAMLGAAVLVGLEIEIVRPYERPDQTRGGQGMEAVRHHLRAEQGADRLDGFRDHGPAGRDLCGRP